MIHIFCQMICHQQKSYILSNDLSIFKTEYNPDSTTLKIGENSYVLSNKLSSTKVSYDSDSATLNIDENSYVLSDSLSNALSSLKVDYNPNSVTLSIGNNSYVLSNDLSSSYIFDPMYDPDIVKPITLYSSLAKSTNVAPSEKFYGYISQDDDNTMSIDFFGFGHNFYCIDSLSNDFDDSKPFAVAVEYNRNQSASSYDTNYSLQIICNSTCRGTIDPTSIESFGRHSSFAHGFKYLGSFNAKYQRPTHYFGFVTNSTTSALAHLASGRETPDFATFSIKYL